MISEKDAEALSNGLCWSLASELHKATGWDILVFYSPTHEEFFHGAVTPDKEHLVDGNGVSKINDFDLLDYDWEADFVSHDRLEDIAGRFYKDKVEQFIPVLIEEWRRNGQAN